MSAWLPEECAVCGRKITVNEDGMFRAHGHPARRCQGSGRDPEKLRRECTSTQDGDGQ